MMTENSADSCPCWTRVICK